MYEIAGFKSRIIVSDRGKKDKTVHIGPEHLANPKVFWTFVL